MTVSAWRRRLADYATGAGAFDLTMAAIVGVTALGWRDAVAIAIWILLARSRRSSLCERIPRATLLR